MLIIPKIYKLIPHNILWYVLHGMFYFMGYQKKMNYRGCDLYIPEWHQNNFVYGTLVRMK